MSRSAHDALAAFPEFITEPRGEILVKVDHSLTHSLSLPRPPLSSLCGTNKQTVYWILAASKGWIKQTYRKIMRTQNTQYWAENYNK